MVASASPAGWNRRLWTGRQDPDHWRDSQYSVEGPVARSMQAVFMDNWVKTTGKHHHGEEYFPDVQPVGNGAAQVFSSSPSGGSESMKLMYLLAITAAKRSINLSSAYFVPDTIAQNALVDAIKRGVRVRIITPGAHMDQETVRRASRARWGELLAAGAEMYEYMPTMYHCKIMIVDEHFVTVGSTNFDPRSFELNDEANLNIFDSRSHGNRSRCSKGCRAVAQDDLCAVAGQTVGERCGNAAAGAAPLNGAGPGGRHAADGCRVAPGQIG
jgi:cardiolipin synthase